MQVAAVTDAAGDERSDLERVFVSPPGAGLPGGLSDHGQCPGRGGRPSKRLPAPGAAGGRGPRRGERVELPLSGSHQQPPSTCSAPAASGRACPWTRPRTRRAPCPGRTRARKRRRSATGCAGPWPPCRRARPRSSRSATSRGRPTATSRACSGSRASPSRSACTAPGNVCRASSGSGREAGDERPDGTQGIEPGRRDRRRARRRAARGRGGRGGGAGVGTDRPRPAGAGFAGRGDHRVRRRAGAPARPSPRRAVGGARAPGRGPPPRLRVLPEGIPAAGDVAAWRSCPGARPRRPRGRRRGV